MTAGESSGSAVTCFGSNLLYPPLIRYTLSLNENSWFGGHYKYKASIFLSQVCCCRISSAALRNLSLNGQGFFTIFSYLFEEKQWLQLQFCELPLHFPQ